MIWRTALYVLVLIAVTLAAGIAFVKYAKADLRTERQVRRDCRTDALRYCPGAVASYLANPNNRDAIIACMVTHRDQLQPKCSRHIY